LRRWSAFTGAIGRRRSPRSIASSAAGGAAIYDIELAGWWGRRRSSSGCAAIRYPHNGRSTSIARAPAPAHHQRNAPIFHDDRQLVAFILSQASASGDRGAASLGARQRGC
jgi:hypothetical protein